MSTLMSSAAQKTFKISRKEASDLLKVSTRTLDRYINSRKLSSKNIAGRIMLDEVELLEYGKFKRKQKSIRRRRYKPGEVEVTEDVENIANDENIDHESSQDVYEVDEAGNIPVEHISPETTETKFEVEQQVYKKLYEELKGDMKLFQQRLEGANYRVGQLESQLETSVPLQDHQKLLTGHKTEKYNKRILYILLGIILAAQPIWIILTYL